MLIAVMRKEAVVARQRTSIYDIARIAGISAGSVSKILNGKGHFSERTRAAVTEIARREGYVVNSAARALRESFTRLVGILTPDVSNDFFSSVILEAELCLRERGYVSLICNFRNDPDIEADCVRSLLEKRVDGVLFVGGRYPVDSSKLTSDLPFVCVDRQLNDAPSGLIVTNDAEAMTYDMTSTLVGHGCERVAYLSVETDAQTVEGTSRYLGYRRALKDAGMRLDKNLVLIGPHRHRSYLESERLVDGILEAGYGMDGVVAIGDRVAIGCSNALRRHGYAVGCDVLVIGMDDSLHSRIASPSLSTVRRYPELLAWDASLCLLAMVEGEREAVCQITIPHKVIERESTLGVAVGHEGG